ncbi:HNH endonuclease [Pseudomonas sp. Marseille-QA0892]
MRGQRWNLQELKLAFYLYCQLPFGRLHARNPEIIDLATMLGRTPSSVAMKLVNFASLDPAVTSTGRKGLDGASRLDREIWDAFHADWEGLAVECAALKLDWAASAEPAIAEMPSEYFVGETRAAVVQQRVRQQFFRRAVLSSYRGRCCMSGLDEPALLLASHIKPWREDKANRLNPANGLCLSALHDRAFDQGLISVSPEYTVIVSPRLAISEQPFVAQVFSKLQSRLLELPERFLPDPAFLAWHRANIFEGSLAE